MWKKKNVDNQLARNGRPLKLYTCSARSICFCTKVRNNKLHDKKSFWWLINFADTGTNTKLYCKYCYNSCYLNNFQTTSISNNAEVSHKNVKQQEECNWPPSFLLDALFLWQRFISYNIIKYLKKLEGIYLSKTWYHIKFL